MRTDVFFDVVKTAPRNDLWDVLKGLGILAVVIGHSGCPEPLQRFISAFHMPLFFIISGILLNELYFDNKKIFIKKKVKSLYIPFVKWALIFILFHNIFFYFGILNSTYGYAGNTDRWYTFQDVVYSLFVAIISMNTFEHLLGAFWFIKALFIGSILFVLLCTKCARIYRLFFQFFPVAIWILCIANIIAKDSFSVLNFIEVRFIGHNEFFAMFFISLGFLMKRYIHYLYGLNKCVVGFIVLFAISQIESVSMAPMIMNVLLLPFSAVGGFIFLLNIGHIFVKKSKWSVYIIRNMGVFSFYILALHFTCFKIISFVKIYLYDLDFDLIAEFPVISIYNEYFWIIYSLVGAFLSFELGKRIERIPFFRR